MRTITNSHRATTVILTAWEPTGYSKHLKKRGTSITPEEITQGLAEAFQSINRVESVYLIASGETLSVFTIIDNDDEETYDLVYNQERALIHRFNGAHFDFNVIARRGRAISEIVGDEAPIWRRSEIGNLCLTGTTT